MMTWLCLPSAFAVVASVCEIIEHIIFYLDNLSDSIAISTQTSPNSSLSVNLGL